MSERKKLLDENQFIIYLKYAIIAVLDLALFVLSNMAICYVTQNGHITGTVYSGILYNYIHLFIMCAAIVIVNQFFGLYRSVWNFAGTDEIVRGIGAGVIESGVLLFIDRIIFVKKGYLPYYAYIVFFILITVSIIAPRLAFRIIKRFA